VNLHANNLYQTGPKSGMVKLIEREKIDVVMEKMLYDGVGYCWSNMSRGRKKLMWYNRYRLEEPLEPTLGHVCSCFVADFFS
jgi:hypothetical protein